MLVRSVTEGNDLLPWADPYIASLFASRAADWGVDSVAATGAAPVVAFAILREPSSLGEPCSTPASRPHILDASRAASKAGARKRPVTEPGWVEISSGVPCATT